MLKQANGIDHQQKREFAVRVPKGKVRKLTIMKFNESLNVRPENWTREVVHLKREDNRRHGVTTGGEVIQDYGEGTEYGKAAREEARRKKLGRQTKKYEHDKQPWELSIEREENRDADQSMEDRGTGSSQISESKTKKKTRKFRSIREAGAGEHADYWIFYRVGNDLEAYKVDEWYQFLPAVTYKYLDAEQAEERFQHQDKVFNHFALKAQIRKQLAEQEEREQQGQFLTKEAGGLKIKDEASSDEEAEGEEEIMDKKNRDYKKGKKAFDAKSKKSSKKQTAKEKKQRVEAGDEIAAYESEDGEDEGREYDYISDSGSDTDREELNVDQKVGEELVGVAEEQGLKKSLESDEEEEEEDADIREENEEIKESDETLDLHEDRVDDNQEEDEERGISRIKAVKNVEAMMAQRGGNKIAEEVCADKEESGGSDTDEDPDKETTKSVLFMQDKRKKVNQGSSNLEVSRKRPVVTEQQAATSSEQAEGIGEVKKLKLTVEEQPVEDEISEAFVRKLLERKPHSTKQLLTKVNQRLQQKQEQSGIVAQQQGKDKRIVARLADILKKIGPYQFRKKNDAGKEVLFFSLNRTT